MGGAGGGSGRCNRAYGAHCDEDAFVRIAAFAGFLVVKERLFRWFCSERHNGASQPSEQFIVLDDEKKYLRHATGVND